ncbi:hypothetical protein NEOLI_001987 [Neolecta irregularis DAH-3]|uniref:Uncharacterized protein n=1 Tax=Neolecta irregularis (strain DAH-3) TaxID=1198029 RepID=A0A1U7LWN6_NEOID|nr:hypothetical protein NEOLI_001987 [Neolecta irregularis DAH-3]|eukprot:OLL26983.1 hypothetical protein NEOLI_001987 [Neolecta irregularis DAH-3]
MSDHLQTLELRCAELDRLIKDLEVEIADIKRLLPPNPCTHNPTHRDQLQRLYYTLCKDRDGFRQERHYVGMKLTRSVRRREKEGFGTEACSTFWVRRIASDPCSAEEILRKGARRISVNKAGRKSLCEESSRSKPLEHKSPSSEDKDQQPPISEVSSLQLLDLPASPLLKKLSLAKPEKLETTSTLKQPYRLPKRPALPISPLPKTPTTPISPKLCTKAFTQPPVSPKSRIPRTLPHRSHPSPPINPNRQYFPATSQGPMKNRVKAIIAATEEAGPSPVPNFASMPANVSKVRQYKPASRIQRF